MALFLHPLLLVILHFMPTASTGCLLTEGPHPPSDPWGSAGSMVQPGYPPILGNSPHLSQHGPFTAINPQDRMVSFYFLLIPWVLSHFLTNVSLSAFVWMCFVLISLFYRNGSHCPFLRKTTPCMVVRSVEPILLVSNPAPAALESPVTHLPLQELVH